MDADLDVVLWECELRASIDEPVEAYVGRRLIEEGQWYKIPDRPCWFCGQPVGWADETFEPRHPVCPPKMRAGWDW